MMKISAVSFSLSNTPETIELWEEKLLKDISSNIEANSQIILYPELFLMELVAYFQGDLVSQMKQSAKYKEEVLLPKISKILEGRDILLCLGSGPKLVGDELYNSAPIWVSGKWIFQDKLHLTPWETDFKQGSNLNIVNFKGFKCAVVICFDIEQPGLGLRLKEEEVDIVLVPFATYNKNGNNRVNRCASGRSIELGALVVTAPLVGDFDCDLIDHHEGAQGVYLPAQEDVTVEQEFTSDYSIGEHMIRTYAVDEEILRKVKIRNSETRPYFKKDNLDLKLIKV
jgi:predicted amidohydrolase